MEITSLHRAGLFDDMQAADIEAILKSLRVGHYRQGEYLFNAGETARSLFLLQEGLVKVSYVTLDGDERILDIFEPGDIFGELFLGKYRFRIGDAVAVNASTAYKLNERDLYEIIQRYPMFAMNFIRHLADEQREVLARMHALLRADARSRFLGVLLSLSRQLCCVDDEEFVLNAAITQEDLANMSGLNRSTVSSLINELRRQKILGGTGRSLTVNRLAVERHLEQSGFELLE